jgi:hypothetical protein
MFRAAWRKATTGFMQEASNLDASMKYHGFSSFARAGATSVWKTGPEGLIPDVTDPLLTNFPEMNKWLESLRFSTVDDMMRQIDELAQSGDLMNAYAFADDFAQQNWRTLMANQGNAGTLPTASNNSKMLIDQLTPPEMLDDIDDLLNQLKGARRNGDAAYLSTFLENLDEMENSWNLSLFERMRADGIRFQAPDITDTLSKARGKLPWQVVAANDQLVDDFGQALHQVINSNAASMRGAPIGAAKQAVSKYIDELHDGLKATDDIDGWMAGTADNLLTGRPGAAQSRNFELTRKLDSLGVTQAARQRISDVTEYYATVLDRMAVRNAAATGVRQLVDDTFTASDDLFRRFNLQQPRGSSAAQMPTQSRAFATRLERGEQFLAHLRTELPAELAKNRAIDDDTIVALGRFARDEVAPALTIKNQTMMATGRAGAEWTGLNYANQYGIDQLISTVFPYHFWITRMAYHWGKLSLANPGASAAYAKLYDMVGDINEQAGLPARVRNSLAIPIPFLNEMFPGADADLGDHIFFDPLKVMFPLAQFQNDIDFNASKDRTLLGKTWDYSQQLTIGNPAITGVLGASGALGDRSTYVQQSVNFPSVGFLPGPRISRAVWDWMTGTTTEPGSDVLSDEERDAILAGEALPESTLRSAFREIVDFATTDGWDGYRTDRAIAGLVGANPEKYSAEDGLRALRDRSGPLYEEAVQLANTEKGFAYLTGWLFMPMRLYPEGEEVQRGLDALYREARDGGEESIDEFFEQHPEYRVRQITKIDRDDPATRDAEIDTSLFYIDLEQITEQFDPEIDKLRDLKLRAEEVGYLQTKEGRRLLSMIDNDLDILYANKERETNALEALYPNRLQELSLRAAPRERALFAARNEFFSIKRSDFGSSDAFFAARDDFLAALPDDEGDSTAGIVLAVASAALVQEFADRIAATPERAAELANQRDEQLRALTAEAAGTLTRAEFSEYISANTRGPSPQRLEYDQARDELTKYFAFDEASGLTSKQTSGMKRDYWDSHPLLNKYFGLSEPAAWNQESAQVYGRMTQIWDGWYSRAQDPFAQKLYLAGHLEELNELRIVVGLQPLRLIDPLNP